MIVADSSVLIEYYRPSGNRTVSDAVADAIAADQLAVNGIIQVEIVSFASSEFERRTLRRDFLAFHWLELERPDFDLAQDIGFALRREGLTIPSLDLVIAASAIRAGAVLYHLDFHFDQIAARSALNVRSKF